MIKYSPYIIYSEAFPEGFADMTEDKDGYWYDEDEVNDEIYDLNAQIRDLKKQLEEIHDISGR